jgi:AraC-like DNA-binding protein
MARIQLRGDWVANTADGIRRHSRAGLIFGPHSRLMRVSVTGGFTSIGFSIRPGTAHALTGRGVAGLVDRLVPAEAFGWPVARGIATLERCKTAEDAVDCLEEIVRALIPPATSRRPDPLTTRFEQIAMANPARSIADCARDCGVDRRKLERVVMRDFGLSPKQVLRRARALDMAAWLRGVADADEANALALRYYDQSHLIREFIELFDMAPKEFVARPLPILTLALESRQAQRLEAMARVAPGAKRPWQD